MVGRLAALLVACGSVWLGAGCGGGDEAEGGRSATEPAPRGERPRGRAGRPSPPPARCPAGAANCRSASGRIIYVESVDPDGDGDAHFVLASAEAITLPGITVVDVRRDLRPHPLPRVGDEISAAGPVYRGSYGQRQIEATELHVARR